MGVRDDLKIGIVQRNIDSELKKVWRTLPFHSPFTALSLPCLACWSLPSLTSRCCLTAFPTASHCRLTTFP